MSKYRPIDTRLWNDRKFLALSDGARLLWLHLLTSPSTIAIPGVIIGGDAAVAEQLGWTVERFRERFQEIEKVGLSVRREGRVTWLPNALKYQPPHNPNQVKAWASAWDDVPEGALKREIWEALKITCKSWSQLFGRLFVEPFHDGSCNGSANGSGNRYTQDQEQNQDQEQKQDQDLEDSATPSAGGSSPGFRGLETSIQRNLGDVGLARARKKPKPNDPTDSERATARVVLDKLGSYNGVEYRYSDAHVRLIVNQLRDGVTEQELRIVIGYCCFGLEWKDDPKMHRHLCPETLFGPKTISKYLDPGRAWFKTIDDRSASEQESPPPSSEQSKYAGPEWQEPNWMLSGGMS